MPFPDAIIHITSPVVISNGVVRCRISENGEIRLLLAMTGVMASFLSTLAVGTVSIPLLLLFPVSDSCVMRCLHVICHNIIGLITAVLKHILWRRVLTVPPGHCGKHPEMLVVLPLVCPALRGVLCVILYSLLQHTSWLENPWCRINRCWQCLSRSQGILYMHESLLHGDPSPSSPVIGTD